MPKRSVGERRDQQLLVRLTLSEFEVLDIAAHLSRQTPNAYAHELLRAHIRVLLNDQFVIQGLANRRAFDDAAARSTRIPLPDRSAVTDAASEDEGEERSQNPPA